MNTVDDDLTIKEALEKANLPYQSDALSKDEQLAARHKFFLKAKNKLYMENAYVMANSRRLLSQRGILKETTPKVISIDIYFNSLPDFIVINICVLDFI